MSYLILFKWVNVEGKTISDWQVADTLEDAQLKVSSIKTMVHMSSAGLRQCQLSELVVMEVKRCELS